MNVEQRGAIESIGEHVKEYTAKFRLGSPQLLAFSDQLELLRAMTQNDEIYLALVRRDICNRRNHVNGYFDQMNLVIAFCSEYELLLSFPISAVCVPV